MTVLGVAGREQTSLPGEISTAQQSVPSNCLDQTWGGFRRGRSASTQPHSEVFRVRLQDKPFCCFCRGQTAEIKHLPGRKQCRFATERLWCSWLEINSEEQRAESGVMHQLASSRLSKPTSSTIRKQVTTNPGKLFLTWKAHKPCSQSTHLHPKHVWYCTFASSVVS